MASMIPCPKNTAGYVTYISLVSQASTLVFQANPTLAAADFKIAKDDGAPAALATTPVVDADYTKRVKIVLSQAETNGDNLTIICSDAAGDEWCDLTINIQTAAQTLDATDVVADAILVDTAVIGALGAGLTAVPWNAAWDAEVESECTDSLNAYDPPTNTEMDAAFTAIKGATWAAGTDTLEHIRDKETDIETDTAVIGALGAGLTALATQASVDTVDTVVDAVKVQTDKLAFTVANQVDSNVLAQANIDFGALQKASITAAVPTVNQIQSGLALTTDVTTAHSTTDGKVDGLNNLSAADVTAAVPTAAAIGTDAAGKVLVTPAQKVVTDASGFVSANVKSQDNIDFGALQKTSLNAATPASVQNINTQTGDAYVAVGALNDLSAANVTTAVDGVLDAANTELAAIPTTIGSLREFLQFVFQYLRNRKTSTATTVSVYKEDATTALGTATISDDGTTFDHGEFS